MNAEYKPLDGDRHMVVSDTSLASTGENENDT